MLIKIVSGLYIIQDGANTGILISGDKALIINPAYKNIVEVLKSQGIHKIEKIIFTHHRRELADGLSEILKHFSPVIGVPFDEEILFTNPAQYWRNKNARWYILVNEHLPYHLTHHIKIPVSETYKNGDKFFWYGFNVDIISTPGYTDGSISYIIEKDGIKTVFSGDLIYSSGKLYDIYSLQHADTRNGIAIGDYHGFLGSQDILKKSLIKIRDIKPDKLIPAHGDVMDEPFTAIDNLIVNIDRLYKNYVEISALRWYYPEYFNGMYDTDKILKNVEIKDLPSEIQIVDNTTWIIIAKTGRAILIDPYEGISIEKVKKMLENGKITGIDYIWISHYHYDHMEKAKEASLIFKSPIITDEKVGDILENPDRYFLTCLSKQRVPIYRQTKDGETWKWENFTITVFHFPGQTYYHSGLLVVSDDGIKYFFAGDSFTPTGIDDYCTWNRNFIGEMKGFDKCIKILQEIQPDFIFNQHVSNGFVFDNKDYDIMQNNLKERESILKDLLPWDNSNFGTDEYWVHTYPYEQNACSGKIIEIQLIIMNHSDTSKKIIAWFSLPEGWKSQKIRTTILGKREICILFTINISQNALPDKYILPVNLIFSGVNLGSFRESIVNIKDSKSNN